MNPRGRGSQRHSGTQKSSFSPTISFFSQTGAARSSCCRQCLGPGPGIWDVYSELMYKLYVRTVCACSGVNPNFMSGNGRYPSLLHTSRTPHPYWVRTSCCLLRASPSSPHRGRASAQGNQRCYTAFSLLATRARAAIVAAIAPHRPRLMARAELPLSADGPGGSLSWAGRSLRRATAGNAQKKALRGQPSVLPQWRSNVYGTRSSRGARSIVVVQ